MKLPFPGRRLISASRRKYKRGKEKKKLVVKVPAGVSEGTKIRLRGMGQKGGIPGDLYVTVRIKN